MEEPKIIIVETPVGRNYFYELWQSYKQREVIRGTRIDWSHAECDCPVAEEDWQGPKHYDAFGTLHKGFGYNP